MADEKDVKYSIGSSIESLLDLSKQEIPSEQALKMATFASVKAAILVFNVGLYVLLAIACASVSKAVASLFPGFMIYLHNNPFYSFFEKNYNDQIILNYGGRYKFPPKYRYLQNVGFVLPLFSKFGCHLDFQVEKACERDEQVKLVKLSKAFGFFSQNNNDVLDNYAFDNTVYAIDAYLSRAENATPNSYHLPGTQIFLDQIYLISDGEEDVYQKMWLMIDKFYISILANEDLIVNTYGRSFFFEILKSFQRLMQINRSGFK